MEARPDAEIMERVSQLQLQLAALAEGIADEESKTPRDMPLLAKSKDLRLDLAGQLLGIQWAMRLA